MKKFSKDLRTHATKIINHEKKNMIPLTTGEKIHHNEQEICYICKKEFDEKNYKVRDHCHYTGKHRGAAHDICNLRYKIPKEIPVVFHIGSTYHYHFLIKELVKELDGNFECLGENTEKYITFSVPIKKKIENKDIEITYKIKFIDSYRFMAMSLSKLIDNLSEGIHNNKCVECKSCLDYIKTKNEKLILKCFNCEQYYKKKFNKELIKRFDSTYEFCNQDLNEFILLLRKGVYPYEYMDNWETLNETSLPNKESFYSNLNMENIEDIDYRHGNNVFKIFKLKNLGEYHDLYVQSNTLLFENFRNKCLEVYELDPAHFLSLPGLAWQACLKKTNVELELLTDYDMLLMVKEGIRGGISHSIHRYAKANNKYMNDYNKNIESSYIQYLDANNLYGWAMSQKLPRSNFKWVEDTSIINEEIIKNYNENSYRGYILEVDVKYPKELHDLDSDLSFLPKKMKIDKYKKLVCDLRNKNKYVVHIKSLKQALNHGLKLKKVHRIIEFSQKAWLKPYMNTELRKLAKDDFEKDLFKSMNNAVFGKTMENIGKHRDIKLVTTNKRRNKLVSEPNYHTINYISEDLSIIEMNKTKIKTNKPIYLGLSILDISKILMYEFWYDYMKPKYGNRVKLCYMDTDSFVTNDFYKDIANDVEKRFDTSNYECNRPLPIGKNKKVIGLMKDELGGKIITEFVTLRPKTYSYSTDDGKEDKKAKGTKKCLIKRMIKFDDYKNCFLKDKVLLKSQQRFISKNMMYIQQKILIK